MRASAHPFSLRFFFGMWQSLRHNDATESESPLPNFLQCHRGLRERPRGEPTRPTRAQWRHVPSHVSGLRE